MKKSILFKIALATLFIGIAVSPIGWLSMKDKKISFTKIQTMVKAYAEEDPCDKAVLTSAEFLECTGCEAVVENVTCVGKKGITYSYAKVPDAPIEG